jgi:hypothetical protein
VLRQADGPESVDPDGFRIDTVPCDERLVGEPDVPSDLERRWPFEDDLGPMIGAQVTHRVGARPQMNDALQVACTVHDDPSIHTWLENAGFSWPHLDGLRGIATAGGKGVRETAGCRDGVRVGKWLGKGADGRAERGVGEGFGAHHLAAYGVGWNQDAAAAQLRERGVHDAVAYEKGALIDSDIAQVHLQATGAKLVGREDDEIPQNGALRQREISP